MAVSGGLLAGRGSASEVMDDAAVEEVLERALERVPLTGRRVLAIVPDGTRTAPIPLLYRLLTGHLAPRAAGLDVLVALGTHQPMPETAVERLLQHRWDAPDALRTIGVIPAAEASRLTGGRLAADVPVRLNRLVDAYDL